MTKATVCRTANYLAGTGMARSDAFRAAWLMAKRGGIAKVSGVTLGIRQRLISRLTTYAQDQVTISLQRDKVSIFDPDAIAVVASVEGKGSATVGYIPARTAPGWPA